MSKNQLPKWTPEREEQLKQIVGREKPVSASTVRTAAEKMETNVNSIAAKLRRMKYEVESLAKSTGKKFTKEQEAELNSFLGNNSNNFTYAEIAEQLFDGAFSHKQIQGKILSMDLTGLVKESPKVEVIKKYTDEEEEQILSLVREGNFLEDIAESMNRPLNSIRGKILSLSTKYEDITIPKQRVYKTKVAATDPLSSLEGLENMTVNEIAEILDKSARGIKIMLTHRKLSCKDYDGFKKAEKLEAKKAAAAVAA